MMESKDVLAIHKLNKDMQELIYNLNVVVNDISMLTEIVYEREIEQCDNDIDIKLRSHM